MYQRILIPSDGSKLSQATVREGVKFARTLGATVVGLYVTPPYVLPYYYVDLVPADYVSAAEHDKLVKKTAQKVLGFIEQTCNTAKVAWETQTETHDYPEKAIVQVAQQRRCDLIFIGSHGRGGLERFFLGSVTLKVLSQCSLPVLVYRQGGTAKRAGKKLRHA